MDSKSNFKICLGHAKSITEVANIKAISPFIRDPPIKFNQYSNVFFIGSNIFFPEEYDYVMYFCENSFYAYKTEEEIKISPFIPGEKIIGHMKGLIGKDIFDH